MTDSDQPQRHDTQSDGVFWSAKIYDEQTDEFFKVRANSDEIRVFPVDEDFSLSTFARFYEHIVEYVDHRAKPVTDSD